MIRTLFFILSLSFLTFCGCTSDNVNSGLTGSINYGLVNCSLDQSFWEYTPYNGTLYLINKDSINTSIYDYKTLSDSTQVTDGSFTIALEPGHYYVFITEYQSFNYNTEITIYLNQLAEKHFNFHSCI
jgi:hypothetical protein